jgi:membrane-associated phospholipid phosphatase/membrane protein DedA with SNARE-associated domain
MAHFLAVHSGFAYVAAMLAAVLQSSSRRAVAAPGRIAIVAVSALAPSGVVAFWPLLFTVTAAAAAGDGIAFALGRRRRERPRRFRPRPEYARAVAESKDLLDRHGARAVLRVAFKPALRVAMPNVAGAQGMPGAQFHPFNFASRLIWAFPHVIAGALLGAGLAALGPLAIPLSALAVVLTAVLWLLLHVVRFAVRRGFPLLVRMTERLRAYALARGCPGWLRLVRLLDPSRNEAQPLALLSLALAAAAWLFFVVIENVVTGDPLVHIDMGVYRLLQDLRTPPGDKLMVAITELGDTIVTLGIGFTVFLWLAWKQAWRTSFYWIGGVVGATVLNGAIKAALQRDRPGDLLYSGWSVFSFPSGHTTANAVLYGLLAFLVASGAGPVRRQTVVSGAAALVLLIAFSRLYLGAHWFSDVAGGLAFGSAFVALLGLFYIRVGREAVAPGQLLAVASCALIVFGAGNIAMRHESDLRRYAVAAPSPDFNVEQWLASGWRLLPARRVNLAGEGAEPFVLQWAGPLHELRERLLQEGWRSPAPWSTTSALAWIGGAMDDDPPPAPAFAGGRLPSLTLERRPDGAFEGDTRLVLRVWASGKMLAGGDVTPVWLGSVVEEPVTFSFSPGPPDLKAADARRRALAAALPDARLVMRGGVADSDAAWDGGVLLAGPGLPDGD